MNLKSRVAVAAALLLAVWPLRAQPLSEAPHGPHHGRNEIAFSVAGAYEIDHEAWTPSLHLHYFRTVRPGSRWALGGGIGYLKGEESHFEAGLGVRFEPVGHLFLTLMPGVTVADRTRFSIHVEATYDVLHIGRLHLGPAAGFGWARDHSHLSVGLHAAVSF